MLSYLALSLIFLPELATKARLDQLLASMQRGSAQGPYLLTWFSAPSTLNPDTLAGLGLRGLGLGLN